MIAKLNDRFVCQPFDLAAAAIAAELESQHKHLPPNLQYGSGSRRVLRADAMIIASAHAAGATEFYSHDRRCLALAKLVMAAHDLPTRLDAPDMFIYDDFLQGDV